MLYGPWTDCTAASVLIYFQGASVVPLGWDHDPVLGYMAWSQNCKEEGEGGEKKKLLWRDVDVWLLPILLPSNPLAWSSLKLPHSQCENNTLLVFLPKTLLFLWLFLSGSSAQEVLCWAGRELLLGFFCASLLLVTWTTSGHPDSPAPHLRHWRAAVAVKNIFKSVTT